MRADGLTLSLVLVFLAFCILMAGVLAICLRERRKIDGYGNPPRHLQTALHLNQAQAYAADKRVAYVLFGSILGGAILALFTGYLVFFREW